MTEIIANRTPELNVFLQMLENNSSTQILLIEAPADFGKSELLERFDQICSSRRIPTFKMSLESAKRGIEYILDCMCMRLEQSRFSNFRRTQNEWKPKTRNFNITVSNNVLGTGNEVRIDPNYKLIYENRLNELQRAFFQDLIAISQKTVILLDTFDRAGESLQHWIEDEFLPVVVDNPHLLVVIAGREVPTSNRIELRSLCRRRNLSPITDEDAWYIFFDRNQYFPLPDYDEAQSWLIIQAFIRGLGGRPAEIRRAIEGVKGWTI